MDQSRIGHNSAAALIKFEVRFFNSLSKFRPKGDGACVITLPAGSTVGHVLEKFGISEDDVYLVLCNGRDVTPNLEGGPRTEFMMDEGDIIALSGPVPYSWGYGAPVV